MAQSRRSDPSPRLRSSTRRGVVAGAALILLSFAGAAAATTERATLPGGTRAALVDRSDLFLEASPLAGEGLLAFTRRFTGGTDGYRDIARLNGNPRRMLAGTRYRVPYPVLSQDWKLGVVRALFAEDRASAGGWIHRSRGESISRMALWFTGDEAHGEAIRAANGLSDRGSRVGQEIRIPNELLLAVFQYVAPAPTPTPRPSPVPRPTGSATERAVPPGAGAPTATPASGSAIVAPVSPPRDRDDAARLLDYGEDAQGRYAQYRLRPGEALYSAVVVRFTGRIHAEDVNALAQEIAKRSGIPDVTDIPVGFPVRIPLDLLLPDFLPSDDPRRLEWEAELRVAGQFKNEARAKGLRGVTVVLDAGHGGADVGASSAGVWESLYVYDVMLRIKRRLESETLARVHTTTRDGSSYQIADRDVLPYSRGHQVLTTPPYTIADSTIGVHLRWYLANSLFGQVAKAGDEKVVFVSIHADSLHPSIRGATVYVPSAALTGGSYGKSGSVFSSRREYRERPKVSFSARERQRSEGLSRDLADHLIRAFRRDELAVHPYQPVRDRIYRGRRAWVPAVLRYNAIPAKVLLEVCNLANSADRKLLTEKAYREKVADTVVEGLLAYFGENG